MKPLVSAGSFATERFRREIERPAERMFDAPGLHAAFGQLLSGLTGVSGSVVSLLQIGPILVALLAAAPVWAQQAAPAAPVPNKGDIAWMIPNDFKNAIAAINFGEPVVLRAPRSGISTSLIGLAGTLSAKNLGLAVTDGTGSVLSSSATKGLSVSVHRCSVHRGAPRHAAGARPHRLTLNPLNGRGTRPTPPEHGITDEHARLEGWGEARPQAASHDGGPSGGAGATVLRTAAAVVPRPAGAAKASEIFARSAGDACDHRVSAARHARRY